MMGSRATHPDSGSTAAYTAVKAGLVVVFAGAVLLSLFNTDAPDPNDAPEASSVPLSDQPRIGPEGVEGPSGPNDTDGPQDPRGPTRSAEELDERERILLGAWLGTWPTEDGSEIANYEKRTNTDLEIVDVFVDWHSPYEHLEPSLATIVDNGAVPMVSWEPHGYTTVQIVEGETVITLRGKRTVTLGEYVQEFTEGLCTFAQETGQPVLLRTMHEMNGHWYSWGVTWQDSKGNVPNSDDSYKLAFQTITDAVREHCTREEVRMVWAINHFSVGEGATFMGAYPGDAYVDYIGVDGYNWGGHAEWGWQSFSTIFREPYCTVTKDTDQPVILAEWGSAEKGGDKAAWIEDAMRTLGSGAYARVSAAVWFNVTKPEAEAGEDVEWAVDSSPAALEAYASAARALQEGALADANVAQQNERALCG